MVATDPVSPKNAAMEVGSTASIDLEGTKSISGNQLCHVSLEPPGLLNQLLLLI